MRKIAKQKYICPELELVKTPTFNLLLPASWNPDDPYSPDLPIIEGDPDDDDNGKGANNFNLLDFDDINGNSGNNGYEPWSQL
ncbi:MAG: hypothetical protein IKX36_00050 [Prevotella sp.]|nr:hypothetical protein [Prevotella sp.]